MGSRGAPRVAFVLRGDVGAQGGFAADAGFGRATARACAARHAMNAAREVDPLVPAGSSGQAGSSSVPWRPAEAPGASTAARALVQQGTSAQPAGGTRPSSRKDPCRNQARPSGWADALVALAPRSL